MPVTTLTGVPPVAALLSITGLAVWAEGLYFLGAGAKPKDHLGHGTTPPPSVARGSGVPPDAYAKADAGAAAAATARIPRLTDPIRAVGMIMFIAGLMDLAMVLYIITGEHIESPVTTTLAAMVTIPAAWFCYLGISQVLNLDMRPVGNVAIPVGLVPLAWWNFFGDSVMIQADLIIWGLAFLACAAHSYGKLPNKVLGSWLTFVAIFAFFLQPAMWALSIPLP